MSNKIVQENIYKSPELIPENDEGYKYLLSVRKKALTLTILTWAAPIALMLLNLPFIVVIFAGCYGLVLWFFTIAASERYKEEAKHLGLGNHVLYGRLLFIFNLCAYPTTLYNISS